jgi:cytochrome c oxidase subunit 1
MKYDYLKPYEDMNRFMTISAIALGLVQIIFYGNFFFSIFKGRKAEVNPWQANSLEWSVDPLDHGNFATIPTVYRGPYEYSVPGAATDHISQTDAVAGQKLAPGHA